MKNSAIIIIVLCCSSNSSSYSQISAHYSQIEGDGYSSTLIPFSEEFVADDFGPRCKGSSINFHSGIDLNGPGGENSDMGFLLRAVEGGQVREGKLGNGAYSFLRLI